jgi:DNA-binding LacI/PurR family transcriptional regulator
MVHIAPETRRRIIEEARRLRYRANPLASGLRGARTMLLGVIVREFTDPFFAGATEAVSTQAAAHGYNVVLGNAHGKADEAMALRTVLETRHTDGILLLGDLSDEPRILEDLRNDSTRLVAMWTGEPVPGICTVNVDNRWGVAAAVKHLVKLGHRDIAFVAGRLLGDIRQRRAAFVDTMKQLGGNVPQGYIQQVRNDPAGGVAALEALTALPTPPTAVIASTDVLAMGILHAANRLGLRVPEDLSVVGFDDIHLAAFTVPSLTTVHMPTAEMAAVAVREALEPSVDAEHVGEHVIRPSFVVRKSTGPVPKRRSPRSSKRVT